MSKRGILSWLDDAVNPIVVKELRQAVQSRFLVLSLLSFFALQLVGLGLYLFSMDPTQLESLDWEGGRQTFCILQNILLAICLLFLPINAGLRLANERSDVNVDLMFVTTLRPHKIINGKMAAALLLTLMIFSACMPFMVFTYFLRGIDLPLIVLVLTIDFAVVVAAVQVCIFLGSLSTNRLIKAFAGLIGLGALLMIYGYTVAGTYALITYPLSITLNDWRFWLLLGCAALAVLFVVGLLYIWSVMFISPPTSNRSLPMRIYLFVSWLLGGIVMGVCSYLVELEGPMLAWLVSSATALGVCVCIAINEREAWSVRVARTIPRWLILRGPAFLLYTGSAGGVLFATSLFVLTVVITFFWPQFLPRTTPFAGLPGFQHEDYLATIRVCSVLFLHLYCYSLTAVFLRGTIFRSVPARFTWVVLIFALALGCVLPYLTSYFLYYRDWRYDNVYPWLVTNPGVAAFEVSSYYWGDVDRRIPFLAFAGIWAVVMTLLNVGWLLRQLRAFQPLRREPIRAAVPPVLEPAALESVPG